MKLDGSIDRLRRAIEAGPPGVEAQVRMAPRPRPGWYPGEIPDGLRDGAGLILLYPVGGELHLPLTVRLENLPQHGGQVSLPGGAREPGESLSGAAIREAEEEIGLDGSGLKVVGILTPLHIPVSGFVLHPVVATCAARPEMHPSEVEVARILEVPLAKLADPATIEFERRRLVGEMREVPYFAIGGEHVWGATAMVLAELLWLMGAPPDPWRGDPAV